MKKLITYLLGVTFIIIAIVACESDFENVGADLVDNNTFDANKVTYEVNAYTKNVLKSRVDNNSLPVQGVINRPVQIALGIYNPKIDNTSSQSKFGVLKAGLVTQLKIPTNTSFGIDPSFDAVVLDIPYNSTRDGSEDDGKPKFILNNVFGDQNEAFNLKVSRLTTFLNNLDSDDPTQPKKYYSDKLYTTDTDFLYNGSFKPNSKDTVLYVRRMEFDAEETDGQYHDTIKKNDSRPSIKLALNEDYFTNNFINNTIGSLDSQDAFNLFFNGLHFEVTNPNDKGSILLLNLADISLDGKSTLTVYYTNTVETDLNGDGDTDDEGESKRTRQSMAFDLNGVRANTFNRDYNGSIIESALDNTAENKKLYIQGAQGSIVTLDAFENIDLDAIRSEDWLINEANLVFNIVQDDNEDEVPTRLFLYKLDQDNDGINENAQILDVLVTSVGENTFDGNLQNEEDDNDDQTTENPLKYRFRITDYISEILKNEDPIQPVKFGIKAFHVTDLPNTQSFNDTIVREFSWDPRGVILYGNDYQPSDADYDKRLKLEIFYTKINQ